MVCWHDTDRSYRITVQKIKQDNYPWLSYRLKRITYISNVSVSSQRVFTVEVKSRRGQRNSSNSPHHSMKNCTSQPTTDQVAKISSSESSLDHHVCQSNPWILLLQWLPINQSRRYKSKSKLLDNYVREGQQWCGGGSEGEDGRGAQGRISNGWERIGQ